MYVHMNLDRIVQYDIFQNKRKNYYLTNKRKNNKNNNVTNPL